MFCHNTGAQTPRSFQVSHAFANAYQTAECPWPTPAGATAEVPPAACLETQPPAKTANSAATALLPSH